MEGKELLKIRATNRQEFGLGAQVPRGTAAPGDWISFY